MTMSMFSILVVCTLAFHPVLPTQNVTEHTSIYNDGTRHSSTGHASSFTDFHEWPHHNSTGYTNTQTSKQKHDGVITGEVQVTGTEALTTTVMANVTQNSTIPSGLIEDEDMALRVLYRFLLFFVPLALLTFIAFLYTTIRRRWKMNKPLLEMM